MVFSDPRKQDGELEASTWKFSAPVCYSTISKQIFYRLFSHNYEKKKKERDKFQPKLKGKMFFVAEMFTYNVLVVSRQEKMKPSRKIKNTNDNTRVNTCKCASKFGIRKNKSNFEYLFLNWFIYYCYLEMTYFFIISNGLYFRTNCRLYVCGLSPFRGHACASDSFT